MLEHSLLKHRRQILVLSSTVSTVLLLVILELVLRIKHFGKTIETTYFPTFASYQEQRKILKSYNNVRYEYAPYVLWKAMPNQHLGVLSTNSMGLRNDEVATKSSDVIRIAMVGGSSVWSLGSTSDETTLPRYLEEKLRPLIATSSAASLKGKTIEVINFGQPGYVSAQELLVWKEFDEYSPDLVIHYGGFNDIYAGLIRKPGWNLPGINESALIGNKLLGAVQLIKLEFSEFINKSELVRYVKYKLLQPQSNGENKPHSSREAIREYNENTELIRSIAENKRLSVMFVFQPSLFWEQKELTPQELKIYDQFLKEVPGAKEYFADAYEQLEAQRAFDDALFDSTQTFKSYKGDLYFDHVHTSDKGNEIMAESLAPHVLKKLEAESN